ncbi:MAG: hypothetical protein AB7F19_05735 [Candidatus Babeliales bacterium]
MKALSTTLHLVQQHIAFMNVSDGIEILFFAVAFFYIAQWLKQDRTQPLLAYFYGYLALTLGSYFCSLFAISFVLCALSPAIAMVFILIHQKTLQSNYIALRNLTPRKQAHHTNWVELLVRSCLVAMNNKKPVMCVIEQRDSLSQFVWAPFILNSYVQPGLIELLLQNPSYDANSFLWLNHEGKLLALSCSWEQFGQEQFTSIWHEDALLFTAKTDAVVMYADPNSHTFSLIAHDKLIEGLSAPQAVRIMSSYVMPSYQSPKGELKYHDKSKTTNSNQPTH